VDIEQFDTIHVLVRGMLLKGVLNGFGNRSVCIEVHKGSHVGYHTMDADEAIILPARIVLFEKKFKSKASVLYSKASFNYPVIKTFFE
jgi:hypothetical protein